MSTNSPGDQPPPYYEGGEVPQTQPSSSSGQQPASGPPSPYGQPAPYGQPSPYGQQSPYGQMSPYQQPGMSYPQAGGYPAVYGGQPFPKNNLGVWALVLGCLSITTCGLFTGIPAVIVGYKGRRAVRDGEADNDGLSLAGIITGWISIGLGALVVLFYGLMFFGVFMSEMAS